MDISGVKVMVIDDSKTIRRTAESLLKKAGCEVSTATDGFEALAMGKKALFCNYTGDPMFTMSGSDEIQLTDPGYALFKKTIDRIMNDPAGFRGDDIRCRQRFFDGNTPARIGAAVNRYVGTRQ